MLKKLRTLIAGRPAEAAPAATIPAGQRVYAVGDIHGRLDLFQMLIERIEADDAARGPADTTVILLGDLVDRGPDSAGVLRTARQWAATRQVRTLAGNHEEMFLGSFERDDTLRHFLRHGGRETLLSFPIDYDTYSRTTIEELRALMPRFVPAEDVAFMRAMEDQIRIGDYLFVHAGIRPGVPLEEQQVSDLRWIRREFIQDRSPRDFVVVHGHTITDEPEMMPLRIGVDTGAYASGRLTAIALEGRDRWLLVATGEASDTDA
ncbi:serine/threonine protein phosphatase [Novosphingobium sp. KCTC 2891]|uniref:metallophosphoesterase family protein n=1 Tax=Novosphingobium sp. KCTC 2891 TaxID=2989730 RepID=UPI002223E261|nr:metallophosphoesterase family protein [Novosphingobium sp. KCTC 2891]MCW1382955.1 serine/threonine protein phosphatase [Novosphingobium sp. KCTC 2891]